MHSHAEPYARSGPGGGLAPPATNASTLAAVVALALVANAAAASPLLPVGLAAASVVVLRLMGVSLTAVLPRLAIPWYIATVAAASQVFLVGSTPLFQVGPLVGFAEGVTRGLLLASKVVGGGVLVLALSLSVPPTELLRLALRWRVPPILVEIAMLTYRYLFLLGEEARRVRDAQAVRLGHSTWRRSVAASSSLAGMVLASAYDRADRVYQAMLVRGYTGAGIIDLGDENRALHWPTLLAVASLLGLALWAGGWQ